MPYMASGSVLRPILIKNNIYFFTPIKSSNTDGACSINRFNGPKTTTFSATLPLLQDEDGSIDSNSSQPYDDHP